MVIVKSAHSLLVSQTSFLQHVVKIIPFNYLPITEIQTVKRII